MFIADLNFTAKKGLAKELRRFIEPSGAKGTKTVKENDLRKWLLAEHDISMYGISEILNVLNSHYTPPVTERLFSKIQKSVVWDTSVCKIPYNELKARFYDDSTNILILSSVYDELLKLTQNKTSNDTDTASQLLLDIVNDSSSEHCTVIDIPKNFSYTDDQLIDFCEQNDYELCTHDYVLGLKAKGKGIKPDILTNIEGQEFPYCPCNLGNNILLTKSVLGNIDLKQLLTYASDSKCNKIIITYDFVESLDNHKGESLQAKNIRDFIRFFVKDTNSSYSTVLDANIVDEASAIEMALKHDAVIVSSNLKECSIFKSHFVPYKYIPSIYSYDNSDTSCSDSFDKSEEKRNNIVQIVTTIENKPQTNAIIPYYSPAKHVLPLATVPETHKFWVLDENNKIVTPGAKNMYDLAPGYTVVHGFSGTADVHYLQVFEVENLKKTGYASMKYSKSFNWQTITSIPDEYRGYANQLVSSLKTKSL